MSLIQIRGLGSPLSWGDVLFFAIVILLWRNWHSLSTFVTRSVGFSAKSWLPGIIRATILSTLIALYVLQHRTVASAIAVGEAALACLLILEVLAHRMASRSGVLWRNVAIVGSGRMAMMAWRAIRTGGITFEHFCGFIDDVDVDEMPPDIADRYLGTLETLPELLLDKEIETLIVAVPIRKSVDDLDTIVAIAGALGTRVLCVRDIFTEQQVVSQDEWDQLLIELLPAPHIRGIGQALKRGFDVTVSALCLLITWPVAIVVMSINAAQGKSFAFRRELVYGHARRQFQMLTLLSDENATRSSRLVNCIPKMWNVFRGEMSLVGPRPLSVQDAIYTEFTALSGRFSVRPGIVEIPTATAADNDPNLDDYEIPRLQHDSLRNSRQNWSIAADLKALTAVVQAELQGGDTRTL